MLKSIALCISEGSSKGILKLEVFFQEAAGQLIDLIIQMVLKLLYMIGNLMSLQFSRKKILIDWSGLIGINPFWAKPKRILYELEHFLHGFFWGAFEEFLEDWENIGIDDKLINGEAFLITHIA